MDIKKINQLNIIIIFYIILLAGFYIFHSGAPIQYIFNEVFNKNLSFFIQNKPEKVELYIKQFDKNFFYFVPIVPIFLYILIFVYNFKNIILSTPKQFFQTNSDTLHFDLKKININYLIAIAAASGLYLELMMIRVHSSFFQIFAFFKNISLISCLLGLGVGYLLGKKKVYSLKWVLPLLTFQICFLFFIKNTPIGPFLQNPVTEQWAMGQSYASGVIQFSIIYCFLILIFIFNAMAFVPLGHLVSNLMSKQEKLQSYSWNLIGSLSGIILFSLMSWMMTPPILWFFVGFLIIFFLQKKSLIDLSFSVVSLTIVIFLFISTKSVNKENYYSPYQVITVEHYPNSNISIKASNLWFQSPHDFRKNTNWNSYFVPFKVAKKKPDNILVVGSGTGNDVAYALLEKTKSIDAVEIDPLIIKIFKKKKICIVFYG